MSNQAHKVTCGCQTEGLAILPVRYSVVPTYINLTRPTWANLAGVTTVPLNDDYQYHIRRTRAGFIYIYLPSDATECAPQNPNATLSEAAKMAQESKHWLVYSIDEMGRFVRQTNIQSVRPVDKEDDAFKCPNLLNNASLCSFITIPNPQNYSTVYIAYSEFEWTVEAMQEYRQSPLPRMQALDIKTWLSQQQQSSATVANEQTLSQILDFDFDFIYDEQLPNNQEEGIEFDAQPEHRDPSQYSFDSKKHIFASDKIYKTKLRSMVGVPVEVKESAIEYKFNEANLKLNMTCQPWCAFDLGYMSNSSENEQKQIAQDSHQTHLHTLSKNMQNYSGDHGTPMILALEDALGIAEELNSYYNDVYGHLMQFQHDAKMECDVKQYLEQIRIFLEKKIAKKDFDIAPYKDDLYIALSQNLTLDSIDYKTNKLNAMMYQKAPFAYDYLQQMKNLPSTAPFFALSVENQAKGLGVDIDFDMTPPMKREFYQLVKSYILLVKDHFYGKPSGSQYYDRFMNFLKFNGDNKPYNIMNNPQKEWQGYYPGTIYEKVIKYSSFEQDATLEELRASAQTLHQHYQKLVKEYQEKAQEYQQALDKKVDKALKKYTSRLDSAAFDRIVAKLDQQVNTLANARAQQLIDWLQKSRYLNFINDLSYEQKTEINSRSELWLKYKTKIDQEIAEALAGKEIESGDVDQLKTINLNGFYFSAVFNRVLQGLDACEKGREFTERLYDLEQLKDIDVESKIYIKTKFWVLGLRALLWNSDITLKVLKQVYKAVDKDKNLDYQKATLEELSIKGLSFFTTQFRTATLKLEYFKELQHLQKVEGLSTVALDTTFGKKRMIIKLGANYDAPPGFILKIYDKLISHCKPFGDGLYSMGAMIAEAAALALSGVIWQTSVVYAHLKYQLMQAWITFKSASAAGVNIGGGFKLLSSAYPAQAKQLIKQLRDSLNTLIKQLDGRFADQLVEINQFFKKTLNIPFQIFSEASTAAITRKQIHLRSARLAFLVGAFEIYNWQYIMDKKPSLFANDADIIMEKLIASSSLLTAVSDFAAYAVRAVRGKATTGFAFAKVSFGIFGGFIAFFSGIKMLDASIDHFKRGNYLAGVYGLLSSSAYLTSGGLTVMLGLSYRYEWVLTFFEKRAEKYIVSQGVQRAFNVFALRFILLRFAGWLGLIALAFELFYDYVSDDEIQLWLSYSALGIYKQEQRYTTHIDQAKAFKAIEMLQAVIEEKVGINLSELGGESLKKIQRDHEVILLETENDALKWILNS